MEGKFFFHQHDFEAEAFPSLGIEHSVSAIFMRITVSAYIWLTRCSNLRPGISHLILSNVMLADK